MIAFLDEFSEAEENLLREYARALNYSQENLNKIISDLKYETSKNLDFDLFKFSAKFFAWNGSILVDV